MGGRSEDPIGGVVLNTEALDTLEGFASKKLDPGRGDELNRAPIGLEFRFEPAEGIYIGEVCDRCAICGNLSWSVGLCVVFGFSGANGEALSQRKTAL